MAVVHRIRKGLDLPLAGAPAQALPAAAEPPAPAVRQVALLAADVPGLRPALAVQPGDRVLRGQALFEDRRNPGVPFTAPAAGVVQAVHRGERRAFVSLVIDVADDDDDDDAAAQVAFRHWAPGVGQGDAAALRALLLETGLWTALRTRPFSRVPVAGASPAALFVTAIDTAPHAPGPHVALAGREPHFALGLQALSRMVAPAPAPVLLCVAPGSPLAAAASAAAPAPAAAHDGAATPPRIEVHEFDGPHPAGAPGTHIHALHPVGSGGAGVWHIGYQDVAAIGHLLATGRLDVRRVVSLAGPAVKRPRLVRTRLGASLADLVRGELVAGEVRVISGSVLEGRAAGGETTAFLGRHHRQVSALLEGRERELFGWITPQPAKFSVWNVVAGRLAALRGRQGPGLPLTTTTNGGDRAMVPIGAYERVMPMDLMATHLLRALAVGDAEQAVALGALELDEEDLALATFVCPGKTEWGPLLRRLLDRVEKEGV
ncbi:MAG: Na(+)-translocating NADH-quinone reductase subunit A [Rubrivivax sp.]|nr:Na(+)-translocating NADH-quinone reductase subunit A [Rubrivivax sp.]